MALIDTTQSHWATLASGGTLTASDWNNVRADIIALVNGAIDGDNIADAGLLAADGDGNFATLDDPSAGASVQTITRATTFTGDLTQDAAVLRPETVESFTTGTQQIDVDGLSHLLIICTGAAASTVSVNRLDNGVEGQILDVVLIATASASSSIAQLDFGTTDNVAGQLYGDTDVISTEGTDQYASVRLLYTDLNETLSFKSWIIVGAIGNH